MHKVGIETVMIIVELASCRHDQKSLSIDRMYTIVTFGVLIAL